MFSDGGLIQGYLCTSEYYTTLKMQTGASWHGEDAHPVSGRPLMWQVYTEGLKGLTAVSEVSQEI